MKRRPRADPVVCTWRGTASQVLSPVKRRGLEGRRENEPTLSFRLSSLQFCMLPDVIEMVFPTVTRSEGWLSFLSAICLRLGGGWRWAVHRTRQRRRGRLCVEPSKEAAALIGCPGFSLELLRQSVALIPNLIWSVRESLVDPEVTVVYVIFLKST